MSRALDENAREELAYLRAEVKRLRKQLNRQSPSLDLLLKRRGFRAFKQEPAAGLLVPAKKHHAGFYRMLHKYSFRLFLRDVIKHQTAFTLKDVTRYATPAVTRDYLDYLAQVKLVRQGPKAFLPARADVTSFGPTLEWYVAELFRREFLAEAVWGVKFRRPNIGGDYDVIARLGGSLVYVEVKSSPPKQIYDSEIAAFLDRVSDLAPAIALFLMDTELRMKDKLVPMFEQEFARRSPAPPPVERMERELFQVSDRIFILNAKDSLVRNIEKALQWFYRHEAGAGGPAPARVESGLTGT